MTNKTKAKESTAASTSADASLPLFFKSPAVISYDRHANAGITVKEDYSFARATNSLPINAIEFLEAVKHYPIVFTNADVPVPVVVVGLEKTNYMVTKKGSWRPHHYIPAYVRQYPFLFYQAPESDQFFLCVDEGSERFNATAGEDAQRFYNDADAKPSALSQNALEFVTAFYRHHEITRNFAQQLKANNLLKPFGSKVTLSSGQEINLTDFQIIDETAFNALPEKTFLQFRADGWLPLIHFALASLLNWKYLAALAEEKA